MIWGTRKKIDLQLGEDDYVGLMNVSSEHGFEVTKDYVGNLDDELARVPYFGVVQENDGWDNDEPHVIFSRNGQIFFAFGEPKYMLERIVRNVLKGGYKKFANINTDYNMALVVGSQEDGRIKHVYLVHNAGRMFYNDWIYSNATVTADMKELLPRIVYDWWNDVVVWRW